MKTRYLTAVIAGVSALALTLSGCTKSASEAQSEGDGGSSNSSAADAGGGSDTGSESSSGTETAEGSGSESTSKSESSEDKNLTVFISADTNIQSLWHDTLIPAFTKANPGYTVKIDFDLHGQHDQQTVAKLTAATVQGKDPGFDLAEGGFVTQLGASGLLTVPTTDDIPELANVPEETLKAGGQGGIPYRASSVLLAYNTTKVSNPPKTLDELLQWIKDNPGRFAYNSPESGGSGKSFVMTVLDKYVPEADRPKMVTDYVPDLEKEWDKGFAELASLNKSMFQHGVYPNGNSQVLDLLASGQIDMAPVWSDQFITGQKNGSIPKSAAYTQIKDPSFTGGAAYLGIPKASKHQEGAFTLLSWLLGNDAQELMSNQIASFPVVKLDTLPQKVQDKFKDADIEHLRAPYFASMQSDMTKLWSEKVPGK